MPGRIGAEQGAPIHIGKVLHEPDTKQVALLPPTMIQPELHAKLKTSFTTPLSPLCVPLPKGLSTGHCKGTQIGEAIGNHDPLT